MWTYNVLSAMKMMVFPDGDLYILNKCEAGYQTEGSGLDEVTWFLLNMNQTWVE